jgi:hypothetical protein
MAALRAERPWKPGPLPVAQRHKKVIQAVEDRIAEGLTDVFDAYIKELFAKDPETCKTHRQTVLRCPDCGAPSERTTFHHGAATYLMDRLAGRPTSRSENTITVKLASAMLESFAEAFDAINDLPDPAERKTAMADRFEVLTAEYAILS